MSRSDANGTILVKSDSSIEFIGPGFVDDNQIITFNDDDSSLESTDPSSLGVVPPGGIILWSGNVIDIPRYWFLCNGQTANSRATPDLRGQFVVGAEDDLGGEVTFNPSTGIQQGTYGTNTQGGEIAHQLTIPEIPRHSHSNGATVSSAESGGGTSAVVSSTGATGGDLYHENRPPYYALAYIMFSPEWS